MKPTRAHAPLTVEVRCIHFVEQVPDDIGCTVGSSACLEEARDVGDIVTGCDQTCFLLAASKHALEAISDSLRVELRHFGVKVSLVEPGDVDTPIWKKSRAAAERLRDQMIKEVDDRVPQEVRDHYAGDITAMRAATTKMAATAMPVSRVVRAVVHALSARRPKTRYLVGAKTWAAVLGLRFLPDGLRDWVVRRNLGLK